MRRVLLLIIAVCLVASGCNSEEPVQQRGPVERSKDRDPDAVLQALREIDACALVNVTLGEKETLKPVAALPSGPHSCDLAEVVDDYPNKLMAVAVGAHFDHAARFAAAPVAIAGAKAYELRDGDRCRITIPVSFTLGVELQHEGLGEAEACSVLREWGKSVVSKLRTPDSVKVNHSKRPLSAWDGCSLLSQAVEDPQNYVFKPQGVYDPLSGCGGERAPEAEGTPSAGVTMRLATRFMRANDTAGSTKRTIAGKKVTIDEQGTDCELSWEQGASRAGNKWVGKIVMELTAECAAANRLAGKIIQLAGTKPDQPGEPQQELLYNPSAPDSPAPGDCLHLALGDSMDCEPYRPTTAPEGYSEIVDADAENRNVGCAVFAPAVQKRFGAKFRPVTYGDHCVFVEPEHSVEISVAVLPSAEEYVPARYGNDEGLYVGHENVQLSGKPARTFFGSKKDTFDVYLSVAGNLNEPGGLHIGLKTRLKRGDGESTDAPEVDATQATAAKLVLADVVEASIN